MDGTGRRLRVLGCMSGTSVDGIDVAAADLELAGEELRCRYLGLLSTPFGADLRAEIIAVLPPGNPGAREVCVLHARLGDAYAAAFARAQRELAGGTAGLAVLHGQTVYHWVDPAGRARGTLQLGSPAAVAEAVGIPVVSDLRSRDIAAGGQGAPLVAAFDALLLAGQAGPPGAAVNLGGIANITVVTAGQPAIAYDIGPAGALMDVAAAWDGGEPFDRDGAAAASGTVSRPLLAALHADPYYRRPWPRSTGREHFNAGYLGALAGQHAPGLARDDLAATVTRLLADLLVDAARQHRLSRLFLSGGGSRNLTTVRWVRDGLPGVTVATSDELGVPVQAKEALAFAVLGFLSWHGVPGSVPAATGARHASILGSFTPGSAPLQLPPPAPHPPTRLRLVPGSGPRNQRGLVPGG
ncbi:MAG TPA: anhydro-N-acetylmuramic acid kinase [Streptosporangiaceae bacterium]|jgi:anhydro-N-acetylmuramic acid kinase